MYLVIGSHEYLLNLYFEEGSVIGPEGTTMNNTATHLEVWDLGWKE